MVPTPPSRPPPRPLLRAPAPPVEEIEDLSLDIELEEDDAEGIAYESGASAVEKTRASANVFAPVSSAGPNAPIVLVIDDDASIRSLITAGLGLRYTVYEAGDGEQALRALDEIPQPDAILCDIMMPKIDGLTLVRTLKKKGLTKSIPIIFLTAKDKPFDVVEGINAGARHYLSKPFKMKELVEKVDAIATKGPRSRR